MRKSFLILSILLCFKLGAVDTDNYLCSFSAYLPFLKNIQSILPKKRDLALGAYIGVGSFLWFITEANGTVTGTPHDNQETRCHCTEWKYFNSSLACARWTCDVHYACFSKNMTVNILPRRDTSYTQAEIQNYVDYKDYETIKIADIQLGDYVQTGENSFKQIFSYAHRKPKLKAKFKQIKTKDGFIELTDNHLIYVKRGKKIKEIFAKDVKSTDKINIYNTWQNITNIENTNDIGVFAPIPDGEQILVNGILASPYSTIKSSKLAKWGYMGRKLNFKLYGPKEIHPDDVIDANIFEKNCVKIMQYMAPSYFVGR